MRITLNQVHRISKRTGDQYIAYERRIRFRRGPLRGVYILLRGPVSGEKGDFLSGVISFRTRRMYPRRMYRRRM